MTNPKWDERRFYKKKYWAEDDILFYLHFQDGRAVRQIEVTSKSRKLLSLDPPVDRESVLCDQSVAELGLEQNDFITRQEFENAWEMK